MTATAALVVLLGVAVAAANGANDVSKGIATLVGAGVSDYRRATLWGTAWTLVGSLVAAFAASPLVSLFEKGFVGPDAQVNVTAATATLVGAAGWVGVATRAALPVSTTHAIVGALAGVAAMAYGAGAVRWDAIATKVALPLLLTPALALALTGTIVFVGRKLPRRRPATGHLLAVVDPVTALATASPNVNHLHWLTSGATCLARGMNDAPKIAALMLVPLSLAGSGQVSRIFVFFLVAIAMASGSLRGGLRVTALLAEKVTRLDHRDGFLTNFVTSVLVALGAFGGVPMSTTHVSSGAIIGAGAQKGRAGLNAATVRNMALAWIVTLPAAAALGIAAYFVMLAFA